MSEEYDPYFGVLVVLTSDDVPHGNWFPSGGPNVTELLEMDVIARLLHLRNDVIATFFVRFSPRLAWSKSTLLDQVRPSSVLAKGFVVLASKSRSEN